MDAFVDTSVVVVVDGVDDEGEAKVVVSVEDEEVDEDEIVSLVGVATAFEASDDAVPAESEPSLGVSLSLLFFLPHMVL